MPTYAATMENGPESFESLLSFDYTEITRKVSVFMTEVVAEASPDCVILVQRKGDRIFRDCFHHNRILDDDVLMIGDDEIPHLDSPPRRILILDDSIKTGNSVCRVLGSLESKCPDAEITVATLISNRKAESRMHGFQGIRFIAMEMYEDAREQDENNGFIFYLTKASGIRSGTGYPGLEFMADCGDIDRMTEFIGRVITDTFGGNTVMCQRDPQKRAMKVTFHLASHPDDGICTSDQKVFLFMDVGVKGMAVRIELLINPTESSIHDLKDASEVSGYAMRMLEGNLEKMRREVSRGLHDRGCLIGEPRIRHPSESRLS